jgi:hypothetical protein
MGTVSTSNIRTIYGWTDRRGIACSAAPRRTECRGAISRPRCAVAEGHVAIAPDLERPHIFSTQNGQRIEPFASRLAS